VNQESSGKKRKVNRKAHERKKSYHHGCRSIAMGEERDRNSVRPKIRSLGDKNPKMRMELEPIR